MNHLQTRQKNDLALMNTDKQQDAAFYLSQNVYEFAHDLVFFGVWIVKIDSKKLGRGRASFFELSSYGSVRAAFPHTGLTLSVWRRNVRWDMDAGFGE